MYDDIRELLVWSKQKVLLSELIDTLELNSIPKPRLSKTVTHGIAFKWSQLEITLSVFDQYVLIVAPNFEWWAEINPSLTGQTIYSGFLLAKLSRKP